MNVLMHGMYVCMYIVQTYRMNEPATNEINQRDIETLKILMKKKRKKKNDKQEPFRKTFIV